MVHYANAVGALAGGTKSDTTLPLWTMPTREEVDDTFSVFINPRECSPQSS